MARFRYCLERARLAAHTREHAAGRSLALARDALDVCRAAYARVERAPQLGPAAPAGVFAARAHAAERARRAYAAETARLRARFDHAREALAAASLRRLRFDAHRALLRGVCDRAGLRAEAREMFEHSGFGRGASATPFESARI